MRYISGRTVAVNHSHGRISSVRQLMKNARRNKNGLAGFYGALLVSEAHLARAFDDEIDFFLLLVVPGHLAAARFERYVTQRKVLRLDRARAANQILRSPPRRIGAPRDLVQIGNDQIGLLLRMRIIPNVLRILLLLVVTLASAAPPKSPPKTWIDPDTGHRIVRLTGEPASASLYFNDNAYTSNGKEMVYTTPNGISILDLQTFKTRPVVEGKVRVIVAGFKTQNVYYIRDGALFSTDVDTKATRRIAAVPPRGSITTVNADETLAAGTYLERDGEDYGGKRQEQTHPLDQPKNKGEMMERRLAARLPLVLFTIDLRTGAMKPLLHSTDWINHLLFSPTDPSLLMYCHEGPWHKVDRIWTIHTDGSGNTLIHKRMMEMEIAGHEFWGADGRTIWYDLQTPRGVDFWLRAITWIPASGHGITWSAMNGRFTSMSRATARYFAATVATPARWRMRRTVNGSIFSGRG
jgi:hypothetical protein